MILITKREIFCCKNLTKPLQNNNGSQLYDANSFQLVKKEENIINEQPVALVYNGIAHTVMMCSPADLTDFAIGFSLAEGIIQNAHEIYGVDEVATAQGIELHIELATRCFVGLKDQRRTMAGRTGCGICGTEKLQHSVKMPPQLPQTLCLPVPLLPHCFDQLNHHQPLHDLTGASHAAAFFDENGHLLALREDVGRHIALDKLLGWHAQAGKPQGFALVSSRASYEMVQKAATCGIEVLAAVSAVTNLAVQVAEQANLTLIGFTRDNRATIYCDKAKRIIL